MVCCFDYFYDNAKSSCECCSYYSWWVWFTDNNTNILHLDVTGYRSPESQME